MKITKWIIIGIVAAVLAAVAIILVANSHEE
jgi:hypothetical protein